MNLKLKDGTEVFEVIGCASASAIIVLNFFATPFIFVLLIENPLGFMIMGFCVLFSASYLHLCLYVIFKEAMTKYHKSKEIDSDKIVKKHDCDCNYKSRVYPLKL